MSRRTQTVVGSDGEYYDEEYYEISSDDDEELNYQRRQTEMRAQRMKARAMYAELERAEAEKDHLRKRQRARARGMYNETRKRTRDDAEADEYQEDQDRNQNEDEDEQQEPCPEPDANMDSRQWYTDFCTGVYGQKYNDLIQKSLTRPLSGRDLRDFRIMTHPDKIKQPSSPFYRWKHCPALAHSCATHANFRPS